MADVRGTAQGVLVLHHSSSSAYGETHGNGILRGRKKCGRLASLLREPLLRFGKSQSPACQGLWLMSRDSITRLPGIRLIQLSVRSRCHRWSERDRIILRHGSERTNHRSSLAIRDRVHRPVPVDGPILMTVLASRLVRRRNRQPPCPRRSRLEAERRLLPRAHLHQRRAHLVPRAMRVW